MPTFIMLTKVSPEALRSPKGVEVLERVADVLLRARFGRAREERGGSEDHRDPPHCPRW